jgi:hypothetical protein
VTDGVSVDGGEVIGQREGTNPVRLFQRPASGHPLKAARVRLPIAELRQVEELAGILQSARAAEAEGAGADHGREPGQLPEIVEGPYDDRRAVRPILVPEGALSDRLENQTPPSEGQRIRYGVP